MGIIEIFEKEGFTHEEFVEIMGVIYGQRREEHSAKVNPEECMCEICIGKMSEVF